MFKIDRQVNIERNRSIEIWTVLENIQSAFLKLKRLGIDLV